MDGIKITVKGVPLLFCTNGDVMDQSGGQEILVGKWRSESAERDNKIRYKVRDVDQTPLQATYAFNDNNQLTAALAGDPGEAAPALTFRGGIEIDRNHNLTYVLIDENGDPTGERITIYGGLSFAETTNNLTIVLAGGGTAEIAGESGVQSLEAEMNHMAAFRADDLLTFHAVTRNPVDGGDPITIPAILDFVGNWDLQNNKLVFASKIKGAIDSPAVVIGFAGRLEAVTAGFVYFSDGNTTEVSLNLRGSHVFRSEKAETEFSWESSLGYSVKKFAASVTAKSVTNFRDGQILAIGGDLTLDQAEGGPLAMKLSLEAKYSFDSNNMLVFRANIAEGSGQPSYDLMLAGAFHYKDLNLTFQVDYLKGPAGENITVAVGIQGSRTSMIQQLSAVLDISQSQAALMLSASFEVHMKFANGVRIKTSEDVRAAGTPGRSSVRSTKRRRHRSAGN